MSTIPDDLRGALANRYDLEQVVGRGGMATVYLARDCKHGRQVAVKVLRPDLAASLGTDRFLKEIEIAARLTHPHIVPLHDSGEANGFLYYVMPYIAGESLRSLLNRERAVEPSRALNIVSRVGDALAYAHRMGVVHRDIKPENILFAEGHPVVTDFGIAKAVSTAGGVNLTRTGFPVGTPGYMSPEQAAGIRELDERTDVYSLACVCYEMLVGEPPGMWLTPEAVHLGRFTDASPAHRRRIDMLPGVVEQTLVRALALRPDERYPGPADFVDALNGVSGQRRKYSDEEVKAIVKHAAEMQAQHPTTETGALSLTAIQEVAAEVGISPARVERAAQELSRREDDVEEANLFKRLFLGAPTTIRVERMVEGDVSETEFAPIVEEIRSTLRNVGHVSTLGRSLAWSTAVSGQGTGRSVHITVTPKGGYTRITIEEHLANIAGGLYGGILGGGGGSGIGIFMGVGLGELGLPLVAFGGTILAVGGSYSIARYFFTSTVRKRTHQLQRLADRLADNVAFTATKPGQLTDPRVRGQLRR